MPASGRIEVNGVVATEGDGVAIEEEELLKVSTQEDSEVLMVDVA